MSMCCLPFSGNRQRAAIFAVSLMVVLFSMVVTPPLCRPSETEGVEQTGSPAMDGLPDLTVAALEERIRIAKEAPKLSSESKQRIISFYQKAIDSLQRREKALARVSEYSETLMEI